jgi:tRNA nucleotidyltransferase (CCA-adding enzyme)
MELRPKTLLKVLQSVDAFRKPERFERFLLACEADARGRQGLEDRPYPQAERFRVAHRAAMGIEVRSLVKQGLQGKAFADAIRQLRLQAIARAIRTSE